MIFKELQHSLKIDIKDQLLKRKMYLTLTFQNVENRLTP